MSSIHFFLDVWRCMRFAFDTIFNNFLSLLAKKQKNDARAVELENHAQFLLVKFNHMQEKIRRVADRYLSLMVDKYVNFSNLMTFFFSMLIHINKV